MLNVAIIIGSTRPGRKAEAVARWVHEIAAKRSDASFEVVDIAAFDLPLLDDCPIRIRPRPREHWSNVQAGPARPMTESETGMKLLRKMSTTLCLLAAASAQAQAINISRSGSRPSRPAPAEHFTGSVSVELLFQAIDPSHASSGLVTFEPGARTAWHVHPRGQVLIVTAGTGHVQRWGDPIEEIRQGDVVRIPPGQKHWHGASPSASMTHIAVQEHLNGTTAEWKERVTDAQYNGMPSSSRGTSPTGKELLK